MPGNETGETPMRVLRLALLLPFALGGCLSFSSSNPPPPKQNTTIVVPPFGQPPGFSGRASVSIENGA